MTDMLLYCVLSHVTIGLVEQAYDSLFEQAAIGLVPNALERLRASSVLANATYALFSPGSKVM